MKLSENWLRQWANPQLTTGELAEQLTMAGLEVDSVSPAAPEFNGVVVGYVTSREQHPNADKLSVCKVDVGDTELLDIVCGAKNVCAGIKVPVATVGGVLPGDFKIKKAKLRGEPSHGMICAARELGLADEVDGIMVLPEDAPIGMDFREYYGLDDNVIDIELTPNRGDCASIAGIARELGVLNNLSVNSVGIESSAVTCDAQKAVNLQAVTACPHYVGRVLKGIQPNVNSPLWLVERLLKSGIRAIHPVVDVCNYVMIELGQPMHGFDLARIQGDITVRLAKPKETLKCLDEQTVTLTVEDCVIADASQPIALAGIMGGFDSGVTQDTTDVFLEAAFFDPVVVSLTARRFGIHSDSSYRFERGVDPTLQRRAIERASELLIDIVGGELGPMVDVADEKTMPITRIVELRRDSIVRLLGITLSDETVERLLSNLGMTVQSVPEGWRVSIPAYRFDISMEADLIEELARVNGYDNIPTKTMRGGLVLPTRLKEILSKSRIEDCLVDRGYQEAITYSFIDDTMAKKIMPKVDGVKLRNPMSSDMAVMRSSLLPGLLSTMLYNQNRQVQRQKLFETGLCFIQEKTDVQQEARIALLAVGSDSPEQWSVTKKNVDFYSVKGDVETLLDLAHQSTDQWVAGSSPALHPGQSADLIREGNIIGQLGVLHPRLVKELGLKQSPVVFEGCLDAIMHKQLPVFTPLSKFPAVRRDLALLIHEHVVATDILQLIEKNSDNLLSNIQIFDIYQGESVEKGKKSIALGLTFQDPSRTLVDTDINTAVQRVVDALEREFKATLRT